MYAGFYPQVADGAMGPTVEGFSPAMREALTMEGLSSAAGYLGSSVFGSIVPLIAVIYGIVTGIFRNPVAPMRVQPEVATSQVGPMTPLPNLPRSCQRSIQRCP
jgi:hypothetical protein